MSDTNTPPAPSKRTLLLSIGGAAITAVVITFAAVLPAEYNKDPLGLGKLTGIARLWAPDETKVDTQGAAGPLAREYETPYRQDTVEIPLGGFLTGQPNSELEYKVRMRQGATLTYSWTVEGAERADDITFDQHGHTTPPPGQGMKVATFKQGSGLKQQGAVTAPFDGIQGWLFQNSGEKPVVVHVKLSGFYELIPGGQPGNESSVVANVPAAQARPDAPLALKAAP